MNLTLVLAFACGSLCWLEGFDCLICWAAPEPNPHATMTLRSGIAGCGGCCGLIVFLIGSFDCDRNDGGLLGGQASEFCLVVGVGVAFVAARKPYRHDRPFTLFVTGAAGAGKGGGGSLRVYNPFRVVWRFAGPGCLRGGGSG